MTEILISQKEIPKEIIKLNKLHPKKYKLIIGCSTNNNSIVKTIYPTVLMSDSAKKVSLETSFNLNPNDKVVVKVYRDKTFKKFACDEIYLFK